MDPAIAVDGRITGTFGTARIELREVNARECVVTHSAQIRLGTTGSLVLRVEGEIVAVRALAVRSRLLAPSLEGMIYRSTLHIDAGDTLRMRHLIAPLDREPVGEPIGA